MTAGTVVHSPRPRMQLRKHIRVAGRCVSKTDFSHEVPSSVAACAVEFLAQDVQVAEVAGCFLDHVCQDPAH